MGIVANENQYKNQTSSQQYADAKILEHNAQSTAHSDIREEIRQVANSTENEKIANKNKAQGYAGLDANGKILSSAVPVVSGEKIGDNAVSENKLSADLAQKINQKMDKADGKVLSDNNFSDEALNLVQSIGDLTRSMQNLDTSKANRTNLEAHISNAAVHVSEAEKQNWNQKLDPTQKNVAGGVAGLNGFGQISDNVIPSNITRNADLKQADWNQTVDTAMDYIKNKPAFVAELGEVNKPLGTYADQLTDTGIYRYTYNGQQCILIVIYNTAIHTVTQMMIAGEYTNPNYPYPSENFPVHIRTTNVPGVGVPRVFSRWERIALRGDILQADWDETDYNSAAFILNKPDIPTQGITATAFTRIEVVDYYPVTEETGVLYVKRATS